MPESVYRDWGNYEKPVRIADFQDKRRHLVPPEFKILEC
jgi:hypothetical protein